MRYMFFEGVDMIVVINVKTSSLEHDMVVALLCLIKRFGLFA